MSPGGRRDTGKKKTPDEQPEGKKKVEFSEEMSLVPAIPSALDPDTPKRNMSSFMKLLDSGGQQLGNGRDINF